MYTEKIWQPSEDDVPDENMKNAPTLAKVKIPKQIESAMGTFNKTNLTLSLTTKAASPKNDTKVQTTKMTIVPDDKKAQAISVHVPLDAPHNQTLVKKPYRLEDSRLVARSLA